jgi:hypothetical protein
MRPPKRRQTLGQRHRRLESAATLLWEPRISHLKLHSFTSALDGVEWTASRLGRFDPWERTSGTHWVWGSMEPEVALGVLEKRKICCPAHVQRVLGINRTGREATTNFHVMSVAVPRLADVPSWQAAYLKKGNATVLPIGVILDTVVCLTVVTYDGKYSYMSSWRRQKPWFSRMEIRWNKERYTDVFLLTQLEYCTHEIAPIKQSCKKLQYENQTNELLTMTEKWGSAINASFVLWANEQTDKTYREINKTIEDRKRLCGKKKFVSQSVWLADTITSIILSFDDDIDIIYLRYLLHTRIKLWSVF